MMKTRTKAVPAILAAFLLLTQIAAATAKEPVPEKPRYKKITGEVISVSPTSIMIQSRTKGQVAIALSEKTDMMGKPARAGDRVSVNYRLDKTGKTATRIKVLPAKEKSLRNMKVSSTTIPPRQPAQ